MLQIPGGNVKIESELTALIIIATRPQNPHSHAFAFMRDERELHHTCMHILMCGNVSFLGHAAVHIEDINCYWIIARATFQ